MPVPKLDANVEDARFSFCRRPIITREVAIFYSYLFKVQIRTRIEKVICATYIISVIDFTACAFLCGEKVVTEENP